MTINSSYDNPAAPAVFRAPSEAVDNNNAPPDQKPVIVATAYPAAGHSGATVQVASHLAQKGYPVYFITGPDFKPAIERSGGIYVENDFKADAAKLALTETIPDAHERILHQLKHIFADGMSIAHRQLKATLERVCDEHPSRPVIILHEALAQSLLPFYFGAPLPKGYDALPPIINFSPQNNYASDENIPPFGPGLPYDPTPENKALWKTIYASFQDSAKILNAYWNPIMRSLGATRDMTEWMFDVFFTLGDVIVFPTSPSTEYPRSGPATERNRYIGGLPLRPLNPDFKYPTWWGRIADNAALPEAERKKVVFITQGTVMVNYKELIVPAVRGLAKREDLLVVVTLGCRGAELTASQLGMEAVPENTTVVDYIPYDVVLAKTDVFVTNAGYNGFMHGIMNGVPMLLAGVEADKGEVAARAEWCGTAVNLRTGTPTEEQIAEGVEKVLGDNRYKARVMALKKENEDMDALRRMEEIVEDLMRRKYGALKE